MKNKTIVITGATSGIGEVASFRLAEQGARIVLVARNPDRAEATLQKIRKANPGAAHAAHIGDLSRLADMKRVAHEIIETVPVIDVLANNAGAIFGKRQITDDGLEKTFALNHMSYFVLTNMLLPHMKAGARIVSTSSDAHRRGGLDFDNLQGQKNFSAWDAYCRSKLENILFTRALAKRLARSGITANCLHPGFVGTRFGDEAGGFHALGLTFAKTMAIKPEEGAKTIIYLASSPEVSDVSGEYFVKCRAEMPSTAARDDVAAEKLWQISEEISGK
jgi:NAD(P)-dependent dehydrogenase (short-subunit alcohol dehydrogenase family)